LNLADLQAQLANANVQAFLRTIRLGEGTSGPDGYNMLVGSTPKHPLLFASFETHPNVLNRQLDSTAAGAFQIIHPTWRALVAQYGFPDFTPPMQDAMAVALIAGQTLGLNALDMVIEGDLAGAVAACAPVWASLPGSTAGQRTEAYAAVEACFLDNGGTIV
jgi:muramidase (phage lysozyme)